MRKVTGQYKPGGPTGDAPPGGRIPEVSERGQLPERTPVRDLCPDSPADAAPAAHSTPTSTIAAARPISDKSRSGSGRAPSAITPRPARARWTARAAAISQYRPEVAASDSLI